MGTRYRVWIVRYEGWRPDGLARRAGRGRSPSSRRSGDHDGPAGPALRRGVQSGGPGWPQKDLGRGPAGAVRYVGDPQPGEPLHCGLNVVHGA